jgi:hypothetical protein
MTLREIRDFNIELSTTRTSSPRILWLTLKASERRSRHSSPGWRQRLMAKRRGRPPGSGQTAATETAENIGSVLGAVMAKVDAWMAQRAEIARELREAADKIMAGENPFGQRVTTPSMLAQQVVKREGQAGLARKRVKTSPAAPAASMKTGRPSGYTMSEEARARIAAAQRKRWAKYRKEQAK